MISCKPERMEVAALNPPSKPLDEFVVLPSDFISSLTRKRDPQFFDNEKDDSDQSVPTGEKDVASTEQEIMVIDDDDDDENDKNYENDKNKENDKNDRDDKNDDNKSEGSDDCQIVNDYSNSAAESVTAKYPAATTPSSSNGVSHDSEKNQNEVVEVDTDSSKSKCKKEDPALIIITGEERKFREDLKGNFSCLDYRLHCTICDSHLGTQSNFTAQERVSLHPKLGVLVCAQCKRKFSINQDVSRTGLHFNACCWCNVQEVELKIQRCSECPCVFCETCIRRNLGSFELNTVKKKIEWKCYLCVNKPIWRLRLIAWELIQYIRKKRIHFRKSFPNAAPDVMEDVDISRCCKSLVRNQCIQPAQSNHMEQQSALRKILAKPHENGQTERSLYSIPVEPRPPSQQSTYATPLFSLTSDMGNANPSNVNSTAAQNINNGRFVDAQKYSSVSSYIGNINVTRPDPFSGGNMAYGQPTGLDISAQNVRNEIRPPQPHPSVHNRFSTQVDPQMHQIVAPQVHQIVAPQVHQIVAPQVHQIVVPQVTSAPNYPNANLPQKPLGNKRKYSSPNIQWIENTIRSTSILLASCSERLSKIEKVANDGYVRSYREIRLACALHDFAQLAIAKFQEIDSQILENYWLIRQTAGKSYKVFSFDSIAAEYGNLLDDPDHELDPGSFLEVQMDGVKSNSEQSESNSENKDKNSNSEYKYKNSNYEHQKAITIFKRPILQLERCDQPPSPYKSKLSTTMKTNKTSFVQYSNKIRSLIEKYGISESQVVLVPVERTKHFK
ncbi:uncharacterized protein LOC111062637 isoform X2 [Nilaparvata lugens]|uniref:uncharacterized protein LOC111062637 isoform X2 n=1 Tax=Nilaparvata lugens TaxID=108931 RepID=UPI00193DAFDF|nr:uncharacterized protein LOC111062637 isoform X2 [Nilaparvata lugens]XP_039279867.1 uncharacterized protein LOC111062637 isoform X2 [Nilaparvata lugens]